MTAAWHLSAKYIQQTPLASVANKQILIISPSSLALFSYLGYPLLEIGNRRNFP